MPSTQEEPLKITKEAFNNLIQIEREAQDEKWGEQRHSDEKWLAILQHPKRSKEDPWRDTKF